jgi:magnesium transporter
MSIFKLIEILEKQKVVGELVNNQKMIRHEAVQALLNKQHNAEIANFIHSNDSDKLTSMLNQLSKENAQQLWHQIPSERKNEILWKLSDDLRLQLAQGKEPDFSIGKVNLFITADNRLQRIDISGRHDLKEIHPVWVDLVNTTHHERAFLSAHFSVELPDPIEETELEVSSRFFIDENQSIHLHSNFLIESNHVSQRVPVAFILHQGILFSIRNQELPVFQLEKRRALTQPHYVNDCVDVLLNLYGADVECSADSLEKIYDTLGKIGRLVLNETVTDEQAAMTLASIAEEEDENGRIRGNILDTQRALNFLIRSKILKSDQTEDVKQILHNIDSLNHHTSFLFDKINFLMDAIIGFININQNKKVNQLTVFSVVCMPINILAGIGGMSEYSMMTQGISWPIAYIVFLLVSIAIGLLTYRSVKFIDKRKLSKRQKKLLS